MAKAGGKTIRPRRRRPRAPLPRYLPVPLKALTPEQRALLKTVGTEGPKLKKKMIERAELHERVGRQLQHDIDVMTGRVRPQWMKDAPSPPQEKAEKAAPAKDSTSKLGKPRGREPLYQRDKIRAIAEGDKKPHGVKKCQWFEHIRELCADQKISVPKNDRTMDRYIGDLYVPPKATQTA